MLPLFPRLLASHRPLAAPAVELGVQYAHSIRHPRCESVILPAWNIQSPVLTT